jgi:GNAT superfamily N-acetyltransferase
VARLLAYPGFYAVVAEVEGKVAGSNFLDERSVVAGIGPITVDPGLMTLKIGRRLMEAVIARAAPRAFLGPGFLVPTRNGELMRWCLGHGLRIATQATLMTIGLYSEPAGPYLPSILY